MENALVVSKCIYEMTYEENKADIWEKGKSGLVSSGGGSKEKPLQLSWIALSCFNFLLSNMLLGALAALKTVVWISGVGS